MRTRSAIALVFGGACLILTAATSSAGREQTCSGRGAGTIAFQRTVFLTEESGSAVTDVWLVDADGKNQRNVTGGDLVPFEGRPAWSPDGQRIAFVRYTGIFVMNRDGRNVRRLSRQNLWDPSWSPTGHALAVASADGAVPTGRVGVLNARGGRVRWLGHKDEEAGDPDWSSAGQITFIQRTGWADTTLEVFVMSALGRDRRRLTRNRETDGTPEWSPNGKRIAFHTGSGIAVMDADGTGVKRITHDPTDYSPTWSPNGTCIAFSRPSDDHIHVVNVGGGPPRRLTTLPRDAFDRSPSWSPG